MGERVEHAAGDDRFRVGSDDLAQGSDHAVGTEHFDVEVTTRRHQLASGVTVAAGEVQPALGLDL